METAVVEGHASGLGFVQDASSSSYTHQRRAFVDGGASRCTVSPLLGPEGSQDDTYTSKLLEPLGTDSDNLIPSRHEQCRKRENPNASAFVDGGASRCTVSPLLGPEGSQDDGTRHPAV
jgi:hypothetical protein